MKLKKKNTPRKNQPEMKNTITEMKKTLVETNSRLDEAENQISDLEDMAPENTQSEQKKKKNLIKWG